MRILFIFLSNLAGKETKKLSVQEADGDILVGKSAHDFNELNKAFGHLLKSTGVADMETFLDIEVSQAEIGHPIGRKVFI